MKYSLLSIFCFIGFFIAACSQNERAESNSDIDNLPITVPVLLAEFDKVGDKYFQHLNYESTYLENGDILLNDREGSFVILVNSDGNLIQEIAGKGNGPGEIQDVLSMNLFANNSVLMFDQRRQRIIRKNLTTAEIKEFNPPQMGENRVSRAYSTHSLNYILLRFWSPGIGSSERKTIFGIYNLKNDTVEKRVEYRGDIWADLLIDDRRVGAAKVPFAPSLLFDISPDQQFIHTFLPEEKTIAKLDIITLDTLQTLPVNLPRERITTAERDSLENEYRPEQWKTVDELLPDIKTPADKMLIDQNDNIWLKLTRNYNSVQEWVVLNASGTPIHRVHLPKDGILTHISNHHLGFRADDHLFAIYEPIPF
ncbi:MAG: hypothetical protein WEA58_13605 [Balneolaceae bacterium]